MLVMMMFEIECDSPVLNLKTQCAKYVDVTKSREKGFGSGMDNGKYDISNN